MASGVSRRMESGESLAIRPDTYAATPRTTLSTNPSWPSAGAYAEAVEPHLAARAERHPRIVLQRDSETAVGAGPETVGFEDGLPRPVPAPVHRLER